MKEPVTHFSPNTLQLGALDPHLASSKQSSKQTSNSSLNSLHKRQPSEGALDASSRNSTSTNNGSPKAHRRERTTDSYGMPRFPSSDGIKEFAERSTIPSLGEVVSMRNSRTSSNKSSRQNSFAVSENITNNHAASASHTIKQPQPLVLSLSKPQVSVKGGQISERMQDLTLKVHDNQVQHPHSNPSIVTNESHAVVSKPTTPTIALDTSALGASPTAKTLPAIKPQELIKLLSPSGSLDETISNHASHILLIDLRSPNDFDYCRLKSSVNVIIPSLIMKRMRRRSMSTFQLEGFINGEESKKIYEKWKARSRSVPAPKRLIVVYDEDATLDIDDNTDVKVLADILNCGFLDIGQRSETTSKDSSIQSEAPYKVMYLHGGIQSLQSIPQSQSLFIGAAFQKSVQISIASPTADNQISDGNEGGSLMNQILSPAHMTSSPMSITPVSATSSLLSPAGSASSQDPPGRKRSRFSIITQVNSDISDATTISTNADVKKVDGGGPKSGGMMNAAAVAALSLGGPILISKNEPHGANVRSPGTPYMDSLNEMDAYSVILPNVYLGSDVIPSSTNAIEQMEKLGITHVLNMAIEVEYEQITKPTSPGSYSVTFKKLGIEDHPEQDIDDVVKEAIEFIASATKDEGNKILVHCKVGKSRSATMVIAYLIAEKRLTLRQAYSLVTKARRGIAPNFGFMLALMKVERDIFGVNSSIE
ncbi:Dual specificity protein phosphatase 1 [Chytridiales sp. JEL 0842]|nr:Dual specificity protein phosphatase 1 [Chytridiales sp. JEL 0842]